MGTRSRQVEDRDPASGLDNLLGQLSGARDEPLTVDEIRGLVPLLREVAELNDPGIFARTQTRRVCGLAARALMQLLETADQN